MPYAVPCGPQARLETLGVHTLAFMAKPEQRKYCESSIFKLIKAPGYKFSFAKEIDVPLGTAKPKIGLCPG